MFDLSSQIIQSTLPYALSSKLGPQAWHADIVQMCRVQTQCCIHVISSAPAEDELATLIIMCWNALHEQCVMHAVCWADSPDWG